MSDASGSAEGKSAKPELSWRSIGGNNKDGKGVGGNAHEYVFTKGDKETRILVDAGSLFSDREADGYDSVYPDLEKQLKKADVLLISHMHMDHLGALAHYAELGFELPDKIKAPPFAAEKLKSTLNSARLDDEKKNSVMDRLETVQDGDVVHEFDGGKVHAIGWTHSSAQSLMYGFETEGGNILHSGDLKMEDAKDRHPLGWGRNTEGLKKFGKKGIDGLVMESLSSLKEGKNTTEKEVEADMIKTARENKDSRLITPIISSNIPRLASIASAAEQTGRTVVLVGASIEDTYRCFKKAVGKVPELIDKDVDIVAAKSKKAQGLSDKEAWLVPTGTQGEEMAAMGRAIEGTHKHLQLGKNDVVTRNQSCIPGNEDSYKAMYDGIEAAGAKVVDVKHSSGHMAKDDTRKFYDEVLEANGGKKFLIMPVHGDMSQLKATAKLAQEKGLDSVVTPNFQGVAFKDGKHRPLEATGKETWIGRYDENDDFLNPDNRYYRIDSNGKKLEEIKYKQSDRGYIRHPGGHREKTGGQQPSKGGQKGKQAPKNRPRKHPKEDKLKKAKNRHYEGRKNKRIASKSTDETEDILDRALEQKYSGRY